MNAATKLPLDVGPIHFVGIGGIGMSGIAEVLLSHGYDVQGSDLKASAITKRLERLGARVFIGQTAENLEGAEVIVISSAIKPGNPELDAARLQGLPVVRAANSGVSTVIDRFGQMNTPLGLDDVAARAYTVRSGPPTLYARTGDTPLLFLLVVVSAILLIAKSRNAIAKDRSSV